MMDMTPGQSPDFPTTLEWALTLSRAGFTVIPTIPGSKLPAEKWHIWEDDQSEEHIRAHWRRNPEHEPGIITNKNLIVFDTDSPQSTEAIDALERKHGLTARLLVETRKGQHRYYYRPDNVVARQSVHSTIMHPERIDVKTDRSLVMAAGSKNKLVKRWEFTDVKGLTAVTQDFVDDVVLNNKASLQASPVARPLRPRNEAPASGNLRKVQALLNVIDPEDYGSWLQAGMAIFHESGGSNEGKALFDNWSSRGSTYKGPSEIELKWRSFEKGYPVTIGTLVHLAKTAGGDVAALFLGCEDDFLPCDSVVASDTTVQASALPAQVELTGQPSVASVNPLLQFSLNGCIDILEKQMVEQRPLLGSIALHGQGTVIYAKANTGKTLIVLHLLIEGIRLGHIVPAKVFYINMDDNSAGLVEKGRLADEFGFHMVADGHQKFEAQKFGLSIAKMTEDDSVNGTIVVIDTLKKFVNIMDKGKASSFTRVLRQFVLKGGTVIALAHANKNPGPDGNVVYSGTTDIVDDLDCAYTLEALHSQSDVTEKVVEFVNIKRRGDVALSVAYGYALERTITYSELLLSVREVDPNRLVPLKKASEQVADAEVISAIRTCITGGIDTKMKLAAAAAKAASISKRNALAVIDKYTGNDPLTCQWYFDIRERGAKVYVLLESHARPSGPPAAKTHL